MRDAERDGLVVLLAVASGSADGWSYFGLAHAFVANMTGNTVLLGFSVFQQHGDIVHPLVALAGYVAGTVAATLVCRPIPEGAAWAQRVSWALFAEALLLIAAEAVWVALDHTPSEKAGLALLAVVALAIGMQSAAMVQLRVPGVVTTYITGTWTTLTNGLTLLATGHLRLDRQTKRGEQQKKRTEERFALQAAVLGAYVLAAILTGWTFSHAESVAGGIPAAAVLLVAGYGALRN